MSSSVRIDGALPTPDANPSLSVVFSRGWSVGFDWAADRVVTAGAPMPLLFPAPFDHDLDGALLGQRGFSDFQYVFQGGSYQRIRLADLQPDGQPAVTSTSWCLPADWDTIDAVFPGGGLKSGFAYFFHDDQYARFDWSTNALSAGYPKKIAPNWHTTAPFEQDLDGEITGLRDAGTKAYLFQSVTVNVDDGGRPTAVPGTSVTVPVYARYDFDQEAFEFAVTDPADVVHNWNGLLPLLDAGPATDLAVSWVTAAQSALAAASLSPATLTAFGHHFMTTTPDQPTVAAVQDGMRQIAERLQAIPDRFQWTPGLPFSAQTSQGVLTEIGDGFSIVCGPNGRAAALIHEAVHFTFGTNIDVPEWSGATINGVLQPLAQANGVVLPAYSAISTADALVNPSSYSAFAQEIAFGSDTRFGAGRPQL